MACFDARAFCRASRNQLRRSQERHLVAIPKWVVKGPLPSEAASSSVGGGGPVPAKSMPAPRPADAGSSGAVRQHVVEFTWPSGRVRAHTFRQPTAQLRFIAHVVGRTLSHMHLCPAAAP